MVTPSTRLSLSSVKVLRGSVNIPARPYAFSKRGVIWHDLRMARFPEGGGSSPEVRAEFKLFFEEPRVGTLPVADYFGI